jgi:hypothetical protein
LLTDVQGHILQLPVSSKGLEPTYVQGLEDNKANYLAVGSNFAFVIGKSFEAPLTPSQIVSPSKEVM